MLDDSLSQASLKNQEKALVEKLLELQLANGELKNEAAESRKNQAELLSNVNKLLRRLDEKDLALSNVTTEKNDFP